MTSVTISCPVNPSEDPDKVRSAVLAIFPDAELEPVEGGFEGTVPSLDSFGKLIRRQRILDAARAVLISNMRGHRTRMSLTSRWRPSGRSLSPTGTLCWGPSRSQSRTTTSSH